MDAELKRKWVEALRSGKYKQGQAGLRDLCDNFCCLGVLADVYGAPWVESGLGAWYNTDGSSGGGFFGAVQGLLTKQMEYYLSKLNDDGASFAEIADYIEANL